MRTRVFIYFILLSFGVSSSVLLSGCRTRKGSQKAAEVESKAQEISALLDSLDLEFEYLQSESEEKVKKEGDFQPSYTRYFRLIHTQLELRPVWDSAWMEGKATLMLSPWFYPQDTLVLDAKGFDIHKIRLGTSETSLEYTYENRKQIHIALGKTYTREDTIKITIEYTAKPNDLKQGGSSAIRSDKGLYFINPDGKNPDRPQQLWTQGETEASSCWFPTIDAPNQKTSQEVWITVPDSFISLSNGRKMKSMNNPDGTRTDYWKQDLPHAPYLFMLAAGKFSHVSDFWRNIPVDYYVEPEYEKYAKMIFGNTPEMIEFFSKKFNFDYPWDKFSQIVVRDFVSGAMENTSAVIHFDALQQDSFSHRDGSYEGIIAHELAHHWFGDLVTAESWAQICMNESFATYSEYLWKEYKYGLSEAEQELENNLSIYLAESRSKMKPLVRHHYHSREEVFDSHSYQKGACLLHYMRSELGDDAFFEGLSQYLKKRKFNTVEMEDLRLVLEEITGRDLKLFFDQWFYSSGHPIVEVNYAWDETENQAEIIVRQVQYAPRIEVYTLNLSAAIYQGDEVKLIPLHISSRDTIFRIPLSVKPDVMVLDHAMVLPGKIEEYREGEEWLFLAKSARRDRQRIRAIEQLMSDVNDEVVFECLLGIAKDKQQWNGVRTSALEALSFYDGDFRKVLLTELKPLLQDTITDVRYMAYALLNQHLEGMDETERLEIFSLSEWVSLFETGLKDSSYNILSEALSGIYTIDTVAGLKVAHSLSHYTNETLGASIIRIYRKASDPALVPFLVRSIRTVEGYSRMMYLGLLGMHIEAGLSVGNAILILNLLKDMAIFSDSPRQRIQAIGVMEIMIEELPAYKPDIFEYLEQRLGKEKEEDVLRRIRSMLEE